MAYPSNLANEMEIVRLISGISFNVRDLDGGSGIPPGDEEFYIVDAAAGIEDDYVHIRYLPLLEVSVKVDVVATTSRTKLTQAFSNHSARRIREVKYCFPLYDGSAVVSFRCDIGTDKVLEGKVKSKEEAKSEYQEAVSHRKVAALLEEHTPEVFETSLGNIPSKTTVKVELVYINKLKPDPCGNGALVTIPTSIAPRCGVAPLGFNRKRGEDTMVETAENGLNVQIDVSNPVPIKKLESRTHPISVELGSHGRPDTSGFDPKRARATLAD